MCAIQWAVTDNKNLSLSLFLQRAWEAEIISTGCDEHILTNQNISLSVNSPVSLSEAFILQHVNCPVDFKLLCVALIYYGIIYRNIDLVSYAADIFSLVDIRLSYYCSYV